ncbi:hypothetical protein J4558_07740 [Leptolyngbya sp. 15MV]|nr:hypothetical protein J4558_07740 [Leptolyngbya sp. 15MV]
MSKWIGAAAWSAKEARAGDRLPYARLLDESTLLLRDGSVMTALQVPGLLFETEDSEALNGHAATREVVLRSILDARFVLYHHVVRRRVEIELDAEFPDPLSRHIDARWKDRLAGGSLFVNDQFVTLIRRPARGKAGLAERAARMFSRRNRDGAEPDPKDVRSLKAAATGLVAALQPYGAALLGEYTGPSGGTNSELLELLSALYNGEMHPVRRPADDVDVGYMLPYRRTSFGIDAMEQRGADAPDFAAIVSLKEYPDATSPGLLDPLLRLPFELIVTETYAPAERTTARERMDLSLRRLKSLLYYLAFLLPVALLTPSLFDALAQRGMDPRQAELSASYGSILLYGSILTLATRCVGQFFYGMQRPMVVMVSGIVANAFNLVCSCVLVFGNGPMPEAFGVFGRACSGIASALGIEPMGIRGSAYGTVLATGLELLIPLALFLGPRMHARYGTRSGWRPSLARIKDLVRLGWPTGATFANEMLCWAFFMVYLVSHFGPLHATAGWIAHQYMSLSFMPAVGLSVATTALVGKYQGMGRSDLAAARAWLGVRVAMVYMGTCGAIFLIFPRTLLSVFIDNDTSPENIATLMGLGTKFLIATAAFQLFDAVAMVISGALRGAGDTLFPGVVTVVLSWAIIVGGGLATVAFLPSLESVGPWIAAAAYIAVLCLVLLARFLTGKWRSITLVHRDPVGH